jgi:hypothetical protein
MDKNKLSKKEIDNIESVDVVQVKPEGSSGSSSNVVLNEK